MKKLKLDGLRSGVKKSLVQDLTLREVRDMLRELAQLAVTPTQAARDHVVSSQQIERKRVVLVVDRGWIFAGDQSLTSDGYVRLDNAVHVFGWREIGFTRMLTEWKTDKVDIRKCMPVEQPPDAILFRVPVDTGWGIK